MVALERQTGPPGGRKGPPKGICRSFRRVVNISFISLMSEALSDNRGRMIVGRAPDNYPAACVLLDSRLFEYASLFEPTGFLIRYWEGGNPLRQQTKIDLAESLD